MNSVLVAGVMGLDHIVTPYAEARDLPGGSVSFAALAAARLAGDVRAFAVVGEDFPREYIDLFRRQGVRTDGFEWLPGRTFRWCGKYEQNMNNRETVSRELNVLEGWEAELPESLRDCPVVILASATSMMHLQILNQCRNARLVLSDTMDYLITLQREETDEMVSRSDIFVLNENEAYIYSGGRSLVEAGEFLLNMGARYVVIKLGEYGSILFGRKEDGSLDMFRCGAWPLRMVVDPTGAGDAFLGALGGYLASLEKEEIEFEDVKKGVAWGTVASSFICEDFSTRKLESVSCEEFLSRFTLFHELTSW